MKKLKVMHILCMSTYSGAENVAITLINSLKDKVDSVYVSPDGSIREVVEQNGIEHYAIDKVSVPNIRKAIKDIEPDIIHAHDHTAGVSAVLSGTKVPIINHLHNNTPWLQTICIKSLAYGISCFRYQQILTVSESVMDEFIFGKFLREKTKVVGNPINITEIRNKADIAELDAPSDIAFLGRLSPEKKPFFFLEIIKDLVKQNPDLRVSMVGDGELRKEVEEKINLYNLGKNITLYGFQNNPYGLLKTSKILCMPSAWEGFGLAAVEALALGKPVVASPVGGLVNIVNDNCGKLCHTKEEFEAEISILLQDTQTYNQKHEGAVKRAEQLNNLKVYREEILSIYNKIYRKKQ